MASKTKTLPDVFKRRVQGIIHILRNRNVWRMQGFDAHKNDMTVELVANGDGSSRLRFRSKADGDAMVEIGQINPGKLSNIVFGEETVLNAEQIGSSEEVVDNRKGVSDVPVKFRDLFSKSSGHETTDEKSAGTSVSISVSATEEIEGVASFEESIETEAHAEISESETDSSETSAEVEGEEETTVPVGKRIRITESRKRADVDVEVTANGTFTHNITAGKHSGGQFQHHRHGAGMGHWDSWDEFVSVIKGDAPDNWCLATDFKDHRPWHADLWVLDPLDSNVRYTVKYEGRILRAYTVEAF